MVLTAPRHTSVVGNPKPRLGPPTPARSNHRKLVDRAKELGQPLRPWQVTVARFINALAPTIGWQYPEVATLAARQNGKTTIMRPLIIERLFAGHRIVHAAQDLKLPREMHEEVATIIDEQYREYLPSKRGVKFGVGQESIRLTTGGVYHIVSNSRSGARGPSNDLVLVDEVLELVNMDFVGAAVPTTVARPWGQVVYFSNAGTSASVVLQWLQVRADNDPSIARLEWSAEPGLAADDLKGWLQANPSIGHAPSLLSNLERFYHAHLAGGTLDVWEREHLCRQTLARHESIISAEQWALQEFVQAVEPSRPTLGIKMDPSGERASAVLAWLEPDDRIGLEVIADVEDHPIKIEELGPALQRIATEKRVIDIVFDPYTDADLAQHLRRAKPLTGRDYANASEKFVRLAANRQFRVRDEGQILAEDLSATIPRAASGGTFIAIKASAETTNSAVEAAIRAVWVASAPRPTGVARIY
jgi:hypothetical protein